MAFFWQVVNGAASYELQVSDSSAFDPPLVLDKMLTTNELDTAKLPVEALFCESGRSTPTALEPGRSSFN